MQEYNASKKHEQNSVHSEIKIKKYNSTRDEWYMENLKEGKNVY